MGEHDQTTRRYGDSNRPQYIPVDEFERWREFQYSVAREERIRKWKAAGAVVLIIGLAIVMMLFLSSQL